MHTCPVCENTSWAGVYKISRWDIKECLFCGFARIDPMPSGFMRPELYSESNVVARNTKKRSAQQKFFAAAKRFFSRIGRRNKSAIFYEKLSKYLASGSNILDIGCGDGSFLKLAKQSFVPTGIEISEYLSRLAREEKDIQIITGDFLALDMGNEKFDGITLISILEHLRDPAQALKKCFDLLRAGGILLIKTVNYGCLNRIARKGTWSGFRPPDHVVYFTPYNLTRLLKKTGFSKTKISAWPFNDNMYCDAWK